MDRDEIERAARAAKGSPFLTTEQAAFYLGVSKRTLQEHRTAGTGPTYRRHCRRVAYHIDDLDAWSRGAPTQGNGDA
jgi:excisionase family DNA binding protein